MKATLVIALAAAGFAGYLVWTHQRAAALMEREEEALERLLTLAASGAAAAPASEGGYRFVRLDGLWYAAPERHLETGVRWFATADGSAAYAFDPVRRTVRDHQADLRPIRRYLARPEAEREKAGLPVGWVKVR